MPTPRLGRLILGDRFESAKKSQTRFLIFWLEIFMSHTMKIARAYTRYAGVLLLSVSAACGGPEARSEPDGQAQETTMEASAEPPGGTAPDVDEERYLDELEPADWQSICRWMVEVQGGPHTVSCGEGVSVTVDTVEVCMEQTEFPHCEVGLLLACVRAQADDLCADAPPACDDFYACVYGTD